MKKYKVALDVMGSDRGPATTLLGAKLALEKNQDLELLLVGQCEQIDPLVDSLGLDRARVEILHADEVITNYDSPTAVLFEKIRKL